MCKKICDIFSCFWDNGFNFFKCIKNQSTLNNIIYKAINTVYFYVLQNLKIFNQNIWYKINNKTWLLFIVFIIILILLKIKL